MTTRSVEAVYFDGKTSEPQAVSISVCEGALTLEGAGWTQTVPRDSLNISEPLGGAPRLLYLPQGGYCEVRDKAGFSALLSALGDGEGAVSRWGRSTRLAIGSVFVLVLAGFLGFQYGVPWVTDRLVHAMPDSVATSLGRGALELLDRSVFESSQLSPERQQALRAHYAELAQAPGPIVFRRSAALSANAVALPDNTIVLTDALVKLAGSDQEIMAVIAHEAGHIANRDHLRALIRGTLVGSIITLWLGDVNFMLAAVPAALFDARYSREAEIAADAHAAAILKRNGLHPELLGRILERIEAAQTSTDGRSQRQGLLDTHPLTRERLERLRHSAVDHGR